jgi:hypothetical protein
MEDTEELYDDLYEDFGGGKQFLKTSLQEIEERLESFKKQEQEFKDKVDVLQKEKEALQRDKSVLIRNISCLFKTAQMEIARNDKQIRELHDENIRLKLAGPHPNSSSNKNGREGVPCVATTVDDRRDFQRKAETSHEQNKQTTNSSLLEVSASHQTPHRRREHAEESNHWKEGELHGRNLPMPQSGRSRSNHTSQCCDDGKTTRKSLSRVSDHHSERDRNMRLEAIKERSSKGSVHPRVPSTDHVEKLAQEEHRLSKRRR